jgi:hypothetical protein
MAWVAVLCRLDGGFVGPGDVSTLRRSDFMPGRRPWVSWCDDRGLRLAALCSLGCGLCVRAALHLEIKRWHVGAAATEGGELG